MSLAMAIIGSDFGLAAVVFTLLVAAAGSVALALSIPRVRRRLVTGPLMRLVRGSLPRMSETERVALDAGSVFWEGDLFRGEPDWQKLLDMKLPGLTERERAFLEGPVEELCAMVDDWEVERQGDLSPETWNFIKSYGFFGLVIPTEHGGLGMSALAHSAIVTKLASRSVTAAVTVMVPSSLGPAELIMRYGTDEQKRHWLPRLATGAEIPCFALTGPEAGSDAAATQSTGVVCSSEHEGRESLFIRLDWRKRYITLAPVATVMGLAFRLLDPDHLMGDQDDLGITCALVPTDLPGIEIGRRHDPLGVPFQNGPTTGVDVLVPIDSIIGGRAMAGHGWRMVVESLAAGRGISLPALSVGLAETATRVVGAYGTVREQFGTRIGEFEGIEEPLARIGGLTYLANAARTLTAGAIDLGERPSVATAIVKAYVTETMRQVVSDAMDIEAGAAICRGPRNTLSRAYIAAPIGITVEGANILTRSLIIYGQGAIRCHPYVQSEMAAIEARDVEAFDRAFTGHVAFVARTALRAFVLAVTNGRAARPRVSGPLRPICSELTRMSAAFAFVSDVTMATLGGGLKRSEKLSGRFADGLAWQYLASAAVKRFRDEGELPRDLPFVRWATTHSLWKAQEALLGILDNYPSSLVGWALRRIVFPVGAWSRPPSDALGAQVARSLIDGHSGRVRVTSDIYIPEPGEPGLGTLEAAYAKVVESLRVEAKIHEAVAAERLERKPRETLLDRAVSAGVVGEDDLRHVREASAARADAIEVDAFDPALHASWRDGIKTPRIPRSA